MKLPVRTGLLVDIFFPIHGIIAANKNSIGMLCGYLRGFGHSCGLGTLDIPPSIETPDAEAPGVSKYKIKTTSINPKTVRAKTLGDKKLEGNTTSTLKYLYAPIAARNAFNDWKECVK